MVLLAVIVLFFCLEGCFQEIAVTKKNLPDLLWPPPPEVPRIYFVNAIASPEDANIKASLSKKLLNFIKGSKKTPIGNPYGITLDSDGRLYVVDSFCKCVHVFDEQNNDHYTFPKGEVSFSLPIGISADSNGYIYITDSAAGVVKVFTNHGKSYVKDIGKNFLERPTGIAVNGKTGELLVVDTVNSQIIRYDLQDHAFKGTMGRTGTGPGMFNFPTNIFVSKSGHIFVTDSLNFRTQIFTQEGVFINSFGKAGDGPGFFSRPRGVAVDSEGNIYVVDALFDNVQIFNENGDILMAFGGPGSSYGEFWLPSGIYIDSSDKIYVADSYNHRIQVFQYLKVENFTAE
jgi:DNA-binding beta-propeller fold protein YncE